jgi:Domain of unknown function (DUF932)
MRLVSRFAKNAVQVGSTHDVLDQETLRRFTPSLFALEPHSSRSERYRYIPTWEVIEALDKEGFKPTFAAQAASRLIDRRGYAKHLVRFRREADMTKPECPEIVCLNSHTGETLFQLFGGCFRGLCLNSHVWGEAYEDIHVRHSGKLIEDVVEGAYRIVDHFDTAMGTIEAWKQIRLDRDETYAFAEAAQTLRLGPPAEGELPTIPAEEFLAVRRPEDAANDLWTTYNRVQENAIAGGLEGVRVTAKGQRRRTTTRPVNSIDMTVSLNRALWTLTERMATLKAA